MRHEHIVEENVKGRFYVNDECIACDTCSQMAPESFKLTPDYDHAYVYHQPSTDEAIKLCDEALEACPVAAIRTRPS